MYLNEFEDSIGIVIVKMLAILYVGILYVIFGTYITTMIDEHGFMDMFIDNHDHKDSVFKLIFETAFVVAILAVFAFIGRNLIQLIPFPLDGLFGFDYKDVKEVQTGSILLVFMFTFSSVLFNKIEILREKLNDVKKNNKFIKSESYKNLGNIVI